MGRWSGDESGWISGSKRSQTSTAVMPVHWRRPRRPFRTRDLGRRLRRADSRSSREGCHAGSESLYTPQRPVAQSLPLSSRTSEPRRHSDRTRGANTSPALSAPSRGLSASHKVNYTTRKVEKLALPAPGAAIPCPLRSRGTIGRPQAAPGGAAAAAARSGRPRGPPLKSPAQGRG